MNKVSATLAAGLLAASTNGVMATVLDIAVTASYSYADWEFLSTDPVYGQGDTLTLDFSVDTDAEDLSSEDVDYVGSLNVREVLRLPVSDISLSVSDVQFDVIEGYISVFEPSITATYVRTSLFIVGENFVVDVSGRLPLPDDLSSPDLPSLIAGTSVSYIEPYLREGFEGYVPEDCPTESSWGCFSIFNDDETIAFTINEPVADTPATPSPVPLPASLGFLLASMAGLGGLRISRRVR